MSRGTARLRLGFRREVLILLPVALLLLVLLSTFTLAAYRQGVERLVEERRESAAAMARSMAARLAAGDESPPVADAEAWTLVGRSGRTLLQRGTPAADDPLAPLAGAEIERPTAFGPAGIEGERVVGFAPLDWYGESSVVRVDLAAHGLAAQQRTVAALLWVVVPVDFAVVALVVLFLRSLLRPYEAMLEQARRLEPEREADDELSYLLSTFERGLAALSADPAIDGDELATLERALGPSLECGLLLLDRETRVLALNDHGVELLEVERPAARAPLDQVLDRHPQILRLVREAVDGGRAGERRETTVEIGGRRQAVGLTVHPLRHDDGSVRGFLALFADLTEIQRQAEEERLAASLTQIGELAAGVAHELRNSLASLTGYLTLAERAREPEAVARELAEIRAEADRLRRVLDDFLSFARPGTTRVETFDLVRVARRAAADPALAGHRIEVTSQGGETVLKGDAQLVERAVRNLLHNAVEAQSGSGRREPIEVAVRSLGDEVELTVDDRGPGVAPELADRVFQPFVTGRPDGVGLGLSLAHRIVDLHRGRIELGDRPGGGARAILRFPAGDA